MKMYVARFGEWFKFLLKYSNKFACLNRPHTSILREILLDTSTFLLANYYIYITIHKLCRIDHSFENFCDSWRESRPRPREERDNSCREFSRRG